MINLIYNGTSILISEQRVLSIINTEYQHIIIMHMDNRYKWKPIREKTTSYYCCDAKASSNSLSPLNLCRIQPIGGYYLNSTSYNLQGSSNSHLFSAGYNLQEAPTSTSYNWHLSSYNLIWKHQIPHSFIKNTCWFTWISALFCSFFIVVHQPSYLPYIISEYSQLLYLLLLLLTLSASFLHSLTSLCISMWYHL